jgi:hypothetical protein
MPRVCWIRWNSVERTHVFPTVWFERERWEALLAITVMGMLSLPWQSRVAENVMEAEIWGLAMRIQLFAAKVNWVGELCFGTVAVEVGATSQEKFKIVPSRVEIKGPVLIGCA